MPSFLREVLTAHELDELGLSDAVRNADVKAPKSLYLRQFLNLRLFLLLMGTFDLLSIGLINLCHYRLWEVNITRLSWSLEVSNDAWTLMAGFLYAIVAVLTEISTCVPLRRQAYTLPSIEPRPGVHPWDIASCWNTFLSKLQIVLDVSFALDCFKADRSILGYAATLTLGVFYFFPRLLLSAFSLSLLFRPTPPRTSIIDFIGSFFGVRASRRLPLRSQAAAFNFPTLRSLVSSKRPRHIQSSKEINGDLCAGILVHRKQALGVSYPSIAYVFIKYFCYLRILIYRCLSALQNLSPSRCLWSSREICRSIEEPLQMQSQQPDDQPSTGISRLATKTHTSTISPDHTSVVEVEMENRNHDSHAGGVETLRRSRGFVSPGPNWMAGVLQATSEEGPTPDSAPEAEVSPLIEYRGWRRQSLSTIETDFYGSILNTMTEIESVAIADDPKIVELATLSLISEYFLTQDTLKEEYVAPDFHEELEFLQTLIIFLRLHVTSLLLNLLRFHCLMSSSFKDSASWATLFGLLSSLIYGIFSFFYASYDQAVIDELMDDD